MRQTMMTVQSKPSSNRLNKNCSLIGHIERLKFQPLFRFHHSIKRIAKAKIRLKFKQRPPLSVPCSYVALVVCIGAISQVTHGYQLFQSFGKIRSDEPAIKQMPTTTDTTRGMMRRTDTILLDGGSTETVQTLEDYLQRMELHENKSEDNTARKPNIESQLEKEESTLAGFSNSSEQIETKSLTVDKPLRPKNQTNAIGAAHIAFEPLPSHEKLKGDASKTIPSEKSSQRNESSARQIAVPVTEASTSSSTTAKPIPQHWQVKSLLNVTHDYPLAYSQIICGYVWPLMAAITLFTNLMIVFVLTQKDMRTPTNVVLTAIAIADIIPIIVPVPWFVYLFAMGNEKQVLYPPVTCYFYQHSTRSVSEIFYFLSTWLNVLLAIQDYLVACWPKIAKKYCQIKVVVVEIVSLTLLAFLLNLPQALKLVFKPVKFYYNGQLTYGCRALQAKWFKDLIGEYVALYDDIFTAIIVVFVDGGPAILLITLTALLIRQLHRQRIQGHLLMEQARTASKRRRERHRQQEYEASARVMIFVLLAFLAVKIPFATTYTLMIIQSRFDIRFVENLVDFQKAISLTDLVFVLSYPLNFTIFCCCSKKFRHKCADLLGECNYNTKSKTSRWMSSLSGSFASDYGLDEKRDSASTITSLSPQKPVSEIANGRKHRPFDLSSLIKQESIEQMRKKIKAQNSIDLSQCDIMDSYCDGLNHFNLHSHNQMAPMNMDANFRAILDDGTLCMQCIMRYEQLRERQREIARAGAPMESRMTVNRRKSSDTTTCSIPIPPPPPAVKTGLYQLPHIVTTKWDSIREQRSSSADDSLSNNLEQIVNDVEASIEKRKDVFIDTQRIQAGTSSGDPITSGDSSLIEEGVYQQSRASSDHSMEFEKPAQRQNQTQNFSFENQKINPMGNKLKWPKRAFSRSTSRVSSDPGSSSGLLGFKQITSLMRRSSDRSTLDEKDRSQGMLTNDDRGGNSDFDDDNRRCLMFSQIENRQRSLSLSNSNLTTLPNATGLLADIFVTTLYNVGCSQEQPGQGQQMQGPQSESNVRSSGQQTSSEKKSRIQGKKAPKAHGPDNDLT